MGYIAGSLRIAQAYYGAQYIAIYSNILQYTLVSPRDYSSSIYWNILEYTGDVSTGRIYRNISQYIPIFSNISGPYIAIYWLIFHISAVNLIVSFSRDREKPFHRGSPRRPGRSRAGRRLNARPHPARLLLPTWTTDRGA